ncbi:hypothetical protein ACCQ10_02605 [Xanthomonas sp. NCPPB 1325]|uniref:hypothetical protein n=1 Tax=Xanthomonas sp. NCPPB 1325 TaxID=487529 RepID=UPI003558775E
MTADVVEDEMDLAKAELSVEHVSEAAYELLVWRAVALPQYFICAGIERSEQGRMLLRL